MAKQNKGIPNARLWMERAIEEMNKSKNEPRGDGKIPPKVGAVAVGPDGGSFTGAHRGELREGDHAEYTLIERKLAAVALDEYTLFTTLEPCVKRNEPKIACCRRTTNARIKTVYVGIEDPDPTVSGKGIKHLENDGVRVIMFDLDLQKEIEKANKDFLLQAHERKRKAVETPEPLPVIEQIVPTASFEGLSKVALQKFIDTADLPFENDQEEFQNYLTELGAMALDKNTGVLKPTGMGILLFGSNPRLTFKQAVLKCNVDYGNDNVESKDFDQALVLIPELVQDWIKKVLPQIKNTHNFKREDDSVFPLDVLREAVINAIVHRDYEIEGAKASLQITGDTITVKSPGKPLPSISMEQLRAFKAPSISRNPIITFVFNLMHYVEESGFGMGALKSLNEKHGLPLPEYSYEDPFLNLVFPRNLEAVKKVSSNPNVQQLSNRQLKGLEWIRQQGEVSTREYSGKFDIGYKTAQRDMAVMKDLGLIADNGEDVNSRNYRYLAVED